MKARNSDRDTMKLAQWEEYVRKTDYSLPASLRTSGAVDEIFIFENENKETATKSLQAFLDTLGGQYEKS
jgi:hypothetical protein